MNKFLLTLGLVSIVKLASAQSFFTPAVSYSISNNSFGVITADFNGDGKADIATANLNSSDVSILLNTGSGAFAPAINYTVTGQPWGLTAADYNGDGKIDIATGSTNGDNIISILLNTGAGVFAPAVTYTAGAAIQRLTSADFDGDGKIDIAVVNQSTNSISVLLNAGSGTFPIATSYPVGSTPNDIVAADFNADGKLDLAVVNSAPDNTISILSNAGAGTFTTQGTYPAGAVNPTSLVVADFDGDSKIDIATANFNNNNISILLNTAGFAVATTYNVGNMSYDIVATDINNDGNIDIATADYNNNTVSVLLNLGSSTYSVQATTYTVDTGPVDIVAGDFNGDGKVDLVTANCGVTDVSVLNSPLPGAALSFDGADDYIAVPNNAALNFGLNDFTIEADFQSSVSQTNYAGIVVKSFNGSDGYGGYQLVVVGNNIAAEFTDGNGNSLGTGNGLQGTSTITDGNWHHLAMVVNRANNNIKLLVDGNVEADVTNSIVSITNVTNPVENMLIGVERTYAIHANANIDEVRIWSRALCQAEIQNNLNGELPASATGLVAYYKFNQGLDNSDNTAITTLTDATSNTLTGTLTNFALTGTTSNFIAAGAVTTGSLVTAFTNTLSVVATQTNVACNGNANGTALVAATGAASPFTYAWSSGGSTTNSATGLAAGNYTCTINNSCGASTTQTFTITQPVLLAASSTSGTIACNGGATTVTVSATGGTPTYSNTGTFTVTAGSYTYTVTDANNCTATTIASVTEPTLLAASSTTGTILCNGGATTVTVSATGGTSTYSNTGTFTVTAGSYTYTVTDVNSCAATTTITVTEPTALTATATAGTILCAGGTTTVTVSATGGTASYTGTGTFTVPASPSQYNYIVTDANNCTASANVAVAEPPVLNAHMATPTNVTCFGLHNATASVTVNGGTPSYSYTWSPSGGNNSSASNIPAGTYSCNITDNNGCTTTATVTITQPAAIATTTQSPVICASSYIIVGTHMYTVAGTYTDVIKSAGGCDSTVITNLTVSHVKAIFTDSFPSCLCNSTVYFSDSSSVTAGDPAVAWSWTIRHSGSAIQTSTLQNPQFILPSGANNVCFKVTTQSGCVDSICQLIHQNITGVQEFQNPATLAIYPNPAQNNFTIETNLTEKQNLDVYDINGNLVYSQTINGTTNINAGALAPGVYNVSLTNNYGIINKRLVILNK